MLVSYYYIQRMYIIHSRPTKKSSLMGHVQALEGLKFDDQRLSLDST
jgi:hypothetical protein